MRFVICLFIEFSLQETMMIVYDFELVMVMFVFVISYNVLDCVVGK